MAGKVQFGSKIGLIAATVGSAVGLGNVWRFPAETQANGGAAFLLVYVLCVLLLGIPVMLGEFAIGREGGTDAVGNYKRLAPGKGWWLVGALGILASFMILCFYMVVAGWTLEYMVNSLTGSLYSGIQSAGDASQQFGEKMHEYIQEDRGPLIYTWLVLLINLGVLLCGVQKGIERMSNILMPLLFVILLVFVAVALTLPNASEGLEFFLKPDFSKITPSVVINALGQSFFSLSLGMGVLITYAAYYPRNTKLTQTAVTVSLLDMLVAVMMGLIIFPAVTSFGLNNADLEGVTLVFVTLPEVFQQVPGTQFWSVLFFVLLFVAAVTSTISIAEVSVRFFQDRCRMSRLKAVVTVILPLAVFASVCSLSQGSWSDIRLFDLNIFDLLDTVATNILLPFGSMLMCIYIGWFAPKGFFRRQLTNNGALRNSMSKVFFFIIRWLAPVAIALIMVGQFVKF